MASTLPNLNSCCSLCSGLEVTITTGGGGGGGSGAGLTLGTTSPSLAGIVAPEDGMEFVNVLTGERWYYNGIQRGAVGIGWVQELA